MSGEESEDSDTAWMKWGACFLEDADPRLFFLEQGYKATDAKAYCDRCEEVENCLAYARRTKSVGVWGGKVFSFGPETPDVTLPVVVEFRPKPKPVVYFEPGKEPAILAGIVNFKKPGIFV